MQRVPDFESYVADLYQEFTGHDAGQTDRLKRFRNIEPESAQFLSMLIHAQQSKRVLEIGTSTGYSTLWLAQALSKTQGRMITVEIDAERSVQAQQHARQLQLDHWVEYRVGDALQFLQQSQGVFDLILLDAERDAYIDYWAHLARLLKPQGGLLLVDNVISHAAEVQEFIQLIQQDSRFIMSTLPLGAGLLMVAYR